MVTGFFSATRARELFFVKEKKRMVSSVDAKVMQGCSAEGERCGTEERVDVLG